MLKYIFGLIFIALAWAACYVFQDFLSFRPAIAVTALVIFIFVLLGVYSSMKGKSAAKKIEKALAGQAKDQAGSARPEVRAQIAQMTAEFDKAVGALKSKGKNALGVLPWYVIIGPPGSGKTTALSKSGLKFPYAASGGRQKVRGVGGTRNCDWWLTNEAIILDTAGRWSVEDEDHDEWTAFLDQLKKTRPGKPVNGIFLAVSVEDLQGEAEVEELAPKLRERIDDLMKRLELVLPVYLLVTKCDLMPGFVESFADLRDKDLRQVWGTTFPIFASAQDRTDMLETQLAELASVIERRALRRLGEERRPEARVGIYELPQQFNAVVDGVRQLTASLFTESPYQDAPILRGVYFTSGTQEGRIVDRLKNKMVEALGVRGGQEGKGEPVLKPRSYFVHDVFRMIAFPDADVAVRSSRVLKKQKLVRVGVAAGALTVAVGTLLLPVSAYRRNRAFVVELHDFVDRLGKVHGLRDPASWTATLEEAAPTADTLADIQKNGPGVGMTFGLYAGDRVLAPVSKAASKLLLAPLLAGDARDMQQYAEGRGDASEGAILGALTLHLLATQPKDADEPNPQNDSWRDKWAAVMGQRAADSWARLARERSTTKAQRTVEKTVTFYALRAIDPTEMPDRKAGLVTKLRQRIVGSDKIDHLKQAESDPAIRPAQLKLSDLVTMAGALFENGENISMSAAFTPDNRAIVLKRLDRLGAARGEDDWILGHREPLSAKEIERLKSGYHRDYMDAWRAFFRKIVLKQPSDLASAPQFLESINPSNLEPLWRNAKQYLEFTDLATVGAEKLKAGAGDLRQWVNEKTGLGSKPAAGTRKLGQEPVYGPSDVTREFEAFFKFADDTNKPTGLDTYFTQVNAIGTALASNSGKPDPKEVEDAYKKARTAMSAVFLARRGPGNWEPQVLDHMLMPPLDGVYHSFKKDKEGGINRGWCGTVFFAWEEQLGRYYPFNPKATAEAKLADVASFFQKDTGTVWKYFNETLAGSVELVGNTFRFKDGAPVPYSESILRFLGRTRDVTNALFARDPGKPGTAVSVRIHGSGPSRIVFELGKNKVAYANGPERFSTADLPWPARGAIFRLYEKRGSSEVETESLEYGESEWALFHLLDRGNVKAMSEDNEDFLAGTWTSQLGDKHVRADFKPRALWSSLRGFDGPPKQIVAGATPCR